MTDVMTDREVRQFDEAGCVTIDTPLSARQVDDACAVFDRLLPCSDGCPRQSRTCNYYDPPLLDIIQHPFFEEAAQRALRAETVQFFQSAIVTAYPEPCKPFSFWQHVDLQYRLSDFQSEPKRILCSFFLWLTDVNESRAPMMFRPGSHLLIGAEREHDPARVTVPPRVEPVALDDLPALRYADPIPLTARAGQVTVLTTAAIHGASVNVDIEPRKNLVLTFLASGVALGLPPHEEAQRREYNRELRTYLRAERIHIIPD